MSEDTFINSNPGGANDPFAPQMLDLQTAMYYVIDHGATTPTGEDMPNADVTGGTTSLPAGDTILSFGFVWPNSNGGGSCTDRFSTVRWDDVVLTSV